MSDMKSEWLPHLHPEVISEVEGNYLDAYVVALEGWRRGLTLRWHVKDSEKFKEMKTWYVDHPGLLFSLHSEEKSHYFFRTRGDKITNEAVERAMDKEVTKNMLQEAGISVPAGKEFTQETTTEELINFANKLGYPVVLKPTDGSFGRGVMTNITTDRELEEAIDYLRHELEEDHMIIEKHITGNDYRLYVVDREVVGAILRVPPNVVGDGVNTIEALIDIKNKERELNPRLVSCPIKIDQELVSYIRRLGYTLKSVPEKDERIFLSDKSNISIGGDPIDVLDELSDEMKSLAVNALRAIPDLSHGAVDMIIHEDDTGKEAGYIIELNPTAQLGGILFPMEGKARDIPKAIIDHYFPETKDVHPNYIAYFSMNDSLRPLRDNVATIATINTLSSTPLQSKKLYAQEQLPIEKQTKIKSIAHKLGINGFIVNDEKENSSSLVILGSKQQLTSFQHSLHQERIHISDETPNNSPVKVGFELAGGKRSMIMKITDQTENIVALQRRKHSLEKEYKRLLSSTSWRVSAPIRKLTALMKGK